MPSPLDDAAPQIQPSSPGYQHFIFISYSRKDSRVARWLQRRLEWFRFPVQLVPQENRPKHPRYLRPIYRDKTHLEVDKEHYWANIQEAIRHSRFLVVLCSPDAARSEPVDKEVRHFLATHPEETGVACLAPVIVGGKVASGDVDECLCPALRELGSQITDRNLPTFIPDGDDSEKEGWENGCIGLVSYLLYLKRQDLLDHVRREEKKKALVARTLAGAFAILAMAAILLGVLAFQNSRDLRKERDRQDQLLFEASQGDHETALRATQEGDHEESLAYLQRALKSYPRNAVALTASVNHVTGLSSAPFMTRSVATFEGDGRPLPTRDIHFSPDGSWIAAGTGNALRIIETATGKELRRWDFNSTVAPVKVSHDGKRVAVGIGEFSKGDLYQIGALSLVEVETGKEVFQNASLGSIESLDFSPNGSWLAVGCSNSLRVLEASSGKEITQVRFKGSVRSVSFSPDSQKLAVGGGLGDQTLRVFDMPKGTEVWRRQFKENVSYVSFSSDGRRIASTTYRTLRVMDAKSGDEVFQVTFPGEFASVNFSPDGQWLAVGIKGAKQTLRLIEAATGKEKPGVNYDDPVWQVRFSPDGRWLAVAGGYKVSNLCVLDTAGGNKVWHTPFQNGVLSANFSADGRWLAACGGDGIMRVFEPTPGKAVFEMLSDDAVRAVSLSPDGNWLTSVSQDQTLRFLETMRGKEIGKVSFLEALQSTSFSPNQNAVAVSTQNGTVAVIECPSGKTIFQNNYGFKAGSVDFSADGLLIAAAIDDDILCVLDANTGKLVKRIGFRGGKINSVAFAPNNHWVAVASGDMVRTLKVMDIHSGKTVFSLDMEGDVLSTNFSSDGRWITAGSSDQTLRVIEVSTQKEVLKEVYESPVSCVEFSSDNHWLAVAVGNKVKVLDAVHYKEVCSTAFESEVHHLCFSHDGRWIALGMKDRTARVLDRRWLLPLTSYSTPQWLDFLQFQANRVFEINGRIHAPSTDHWKQFQSSIHQTSPSPDGDASEQNAAGVEPVLTWFHRLPEQRMASPWTMLPLRKQQGAHLMQSHSKEAILSLVSSAPWHPLSPIALARTESKESNATYNERVRFLARLTLQRLRQADSELYDQDSLADYYATAALWMSQELGLKEEVLEVAEEALKRRATSHLAWRAKAKALGKLQRKEEALATYMQLWTHPDATVGDFTDGGYLAAQLQKKEQVDQAFRAGMERFPSNPSTARMEGWARLNLNDSEGAAKSFQRCLQLLTDAKAKPDTDLLAGLTIAHWLLKDAVKATEYCKALIESNTAWAKVETIQQQGWPEMETKPLLEALAATLQKHPELAPKP